MLSETVTQKAPKDGAERSRQLPLKKAAEKRAEAAKAPRYNGQAFGGFLGACP